MNAKQEFLDRFGNLEILCADIDWQDVWLDLPNTDHRLPLNYTQEQYNQFIDSLDFGYDNGYGGQELFGTVWFKDGTWADRGEYDGSEW